MEKKLTDEELQQEKSFEEFRKAYYNAEKGYSDWLANGGCGDENEENTLYQMRDIINLIQRQKAEIERLTEENEYLDGCAKQFLADYQKCEIERAELQNQVDEYFKKAYFYYQKCKAYGIENFYDDELEPKPAKEGKTIVFPKFNGEYEVK